MVGSVRLFPLCLRYHAQFAVGGFAPISLDWSALFFSTLASISSSVLRSFNFPSSSRSDLFLIFSCPRAYSNCAMVALIVFIFSSSTVFLGLAACPFLQLVAMQFVQCLFTFLHSQGALPFPVHAPSGLHWQHTRSAVLSSFFSSSLSVLFSSRSLGFSRFCLF